MNSRREKIEAVIQHYIKSQENGIKDVDMQLKIFADDCMFHCFLNTNIVGKKAGYAVANNKNELRQVMENYNKNIGSPENIDITYPDWIIDEENLCCSFNLRIKGISKDGEKYNLLNALQFQLNEDFKVVKAYNWHGILNNE